MSKLPHQAGEISWQYEVEIVPGKLDDFISVARGLFATMDQEPGTLDYNYYLSPDNTVCHIYEHYRDSDSLVAHADNFRNVFAERFMAACTPKRLSVYGTPSDPVKAVLAQYGAVFFSTIGK
jgi:quinol monooxygenase YgiN